MQYTFYDHSSFLAFSALKLDKIYSLHGKTQRIQITRQNKVSGRDSCKKLYFFSQSQSFMGNQGDEKISYYHHAKKFNPCPGYHKLFLESYDIRFMEFLFAVLLDDVGGAMGNSNTWK